MRNLPFRKGFTLLEMLVALLISGIVLESFAPLLNLCVKLPLDTDFQQDLNGIQQLRNYLMLGKITEVTIWEINFTYKDKEFTLEQVNDSLMVTPGTNIFLDNIDDIYIDDDGMGRIYLSYTRKDVTRRVMIHE